MCRGLIWRGAGNIVFLLSGIVSRMGAMRYHDALISSDLFRLSIDFRCEILGNEINQLLQIDFFLTNFLSTYLNLTQNENSRCT